MMYLNFFDKISSFGNQFYEIAFGFLRDLPGVVKGFVAIAILVLMALGILTLLKKSFKIFGILIAIGIIIVVVSVFLK